MGRKKRRSKRAVQESAVGGTSYNPPTMKNSEGLWIFERGESGKKDGEKNSRRREGEGNVENGTLRGQG